MVLAFWYRCRMCGKEFKAAAGRRPFVTDCLIDLLCEDRTTTIPSASLVVPGRYDLHHHDDGSIGFADLIGVKNYMEGDAE